LNIKVYSSFSSYLYQSGYYRYLIKVGLGLGFRWGHVSQSAFAAFINLGLLVCQSSVLPKLKRNSFMTNWIDYFAIIEITITKLPISFDHFDNFETGRVLYFAKHKITKLSVFCRALFIKNKVEILQGFSRENTSYKMKTMGSLLF